MPKKFRNESVIVSRIPSNLHQVLIRIQAKDDISFEEACEKAAILIDKNSTIFDEEINSRANSQYKKRYMTEMNKARQSIAKEGQQASYDLGYKNGQKDGFASGDDSGFKRGAREVFPKGWELGYKEGSFRWKFACKKCGGAGTLTDNEWKNITEGSEGVSHKICNVGPLFEYLVSQFTGAPATGQAYDDVRSGVKNILTAAPPGAF